ncbi:MAG: carboxymuconolactone decarboxylase family protein [Planctomycetes bacterium]|nr:carboxymuconolactone decarboxylase family protein [Planctomycetota bacterium]
MNAMKAAAPDIGKAFGPFFQGLMKEGALSVREKELIALGIGVALRCEPCIYAHVEKCVKSGATPEQIMEAAGVAVMMQGGPAYTYAPVVARAVEHFRAAVAN